MLERHDSNLELTAHSQLNSSEMLLVSEFPGKFLCVFESAFHMAYERCLP